MPQTKKSTKKTAKAEKKPAAKAKTSSVKADKKPEAKADTAPKTAKKKSSNKVFIIIAIVVGIAAITGICITAGSIFGKWFSGGNETIQISDGSKVKVAKNTTSAMQYETYDNGLVSMRIPKGWKVSVAQSDYIHYTFMAYNPENPNYRIFFNMKTEGYLKNKAMRDWYSSMYPAASFSKLPYIDPQTTEQFYKVFTEAFAEENTAAFTFPVIKSFKKIESLGKNITGGEIIRGTYKDANGKTVDGVFSATIKEVSLYYVTALNVYTTIFFTAPENELTEWESILNECVGSIQFSNNFVSGFNSQQDIIMGGIAANQKIYSEMSDIITKGWEARQSTYDTLSQKRSDATLGYERVYDTTTGDIYKAYNGFTDDYKGDRYQAVTDKMYNLPTAGYIEK